MALINNQKFFQVQGMLENKTLKHCGARIYIRNFYLTDETDVVVEESYKRTGRMSGLTGTFSKIKCIYVNIREMVSYDLGLISYFSSPISLLFHAVCFSRIGFILLQSVSRRYYYFLSTSSTHGKNVI